MATSKVVVLIPNGRRQNIIINPNTTLLQVLEEACEKHGFSSEEYCLKHHQKEISLTQMFRFSGLPKNCLLEMSKTERKRMLTDVNICIQLEDGQRRQAQFKPEDNLWSVVINLAVDAVQNYESPILIYMRQEIIGMDNMSRTTLKSLGIIDGRALMRLINKKPEELKTQANVYVSSSSNNPSKSNGDKTGMDSSKVSDISVSLKNLTESLIKSLPNKCPIGEEKKENDGVNDVPGMINQDVDKEMKYDWDMGIGYSMQKIKSQINETSNDAMNGYTYKEPVYRIIGERDAVIYSLNDSHTSVEDLPDSFYDLTVNDLKLILRDLRNIAAGNSNELLLTSNLREYHYNQNMLNKIAQYKNCVLRIKFSDKHILQGIFKPVENISDVFAFVKKFLNKPNKPYYLFTTPPKTRLPLDKTLLELNLVPNALIHFSYIEEEENDNQIIKTEYLDQLTSSEGASHVAKKIRKMQRKISNGERDGNDNKSDEPSCSSGAISKRPRNEGINPQ